VQYRLHIKTAAGKEYASDYVDVKTSPPIDSISWKRTGDGVQIYANTHDPNNASHYYRWDWQETWQFHSVYYTYVQWVNEQIQPFSDFYYTCFSYAHSTSVLVNATTKLSQDEVFQFPVELVPSNSWLISVRYSILVKQYVLTQDAYNYWSDLQKNTEQIGSIFGPQPFASQGNIHNLADPTEQVVGFISAGTLQKQRIFITPDQIPNWGIGTYDQCSLARTILDSLPFFLDQGNNLPVDQIETGPGHYVYDLAASPCVDCRFIGSLKPPPYW
jgi:hypothetical protein